MRAASTRRKIAIQIAKAANREAAAADSQSVSEDGDGRLTRCKNAWDVAAPSSATGKITTL